MWNRSENKINCIFIRHGCTVSNREHRYLGRTDEPLDEAGVFELENALNNGVYKALEENSLKEQIIITSPMSRNNKQLCSRYGRWQLQQLQV